jgi:AraC-like DNA-binding protein
MVPMARNRANSSKSDVFAGTSTTGKADNGSSPRLQGLDSNPQSAFGPQVWQAFRNSVAHIYDTVSLVDPADEARFTLATRTYPLPHAVLMDCKGTAFKITRGPVSAARSADQILIVLQTEGSVDLDYGGRRERRQVGDVEIVDYARPYNSAATDYGLLMLSIARGSVPAALRTLDLHGLIFPRESGAARLIGAAVQELFAQADNLTVSEAEAAVDGLMALTTSCARAKLARDEAHHVKSRRRAAFDYVDAHLGNAELGPDEIANAAHVSRASLYRLLAVEGGIRAVLLTRRLDQALRLMLADQNDESSLTEIAKRCGFGGMSQFSRAFRARFGTPPRQYLTLIRQQDLDWHEARLMADGFDQNAFLWRQQGLSGADDSHAPIGVVKQSSDPD